MVYSPEPRLIELPGASSNANAGEDMRMKTIPTMMYPILPKR